MNDIVQSQRKLPPNPYTTVRIPSIKSSGSTRALKRRESFFKRPTLTTFSASDFQKRYDDDKSEQGSSSSRTDIRSFLERFSLPRVVKTSHDNEALLLFKYLEDYTSVTALKVTGKQRKKDLDHENILYLPDGYQGWFSLTNDDKNATAIGYSSIVQLIQEQVYTFLSTTSIVGYIFNSEQSGSYLKFTSNAGEVFQLRGIFQHNPRIPENSRNNKGRDLANRYAQLINISTKQEMYVPLIAKGCFYEIGQTQGRANSRPKSLCKVRVKDPSQVDKDCIYRLSHLVKLVSLPTTVKLIAGQVPKNFGKTSSTDVFILQSKVTEPVLFTCKLPMNTDEQYQIKYLNYDTDIKLCRTLLGFESEQTMLQSPRLQNAFTYCRQYFDKFYTRARTWTEFHDFQTKLRHTDSEDPETITTTSNRGLLKWLKNLKFETSHNQELDRYKDMSKLIDETRNMSKKTIIGSLDSVYKPLDRVENQTFSEENLSTIKHSFITDRLCSKFHVKTKRVQVVKPKVPVRDKVVQSPAVPPSTSLLEDLPYVSAVDALGISETGAENIYVEICENEKVDLDLEMSYVHLNLTNQDEPIYSTLK